VVDDHDDLSRFFALCPNRRDCGDEIVPPPVTIGADND